MRGARWAGWVAFALAMALAFAIPTAAGPGQDSKKGKNKRSADPGLLAEDRGTLDIQVDGQKAGTEEFEIHDSGGEWTARGTSEVLAENGGRTKITGKLSLSPDGAPLRYEWTATAPRKATSTIVFEGTVAKMELKLDNASPYTQEFRFQAPPVVILDNNMYHQYMILARLYDWEHKESKTYAVLIPQDLTPGTVTADYGGQQVVEGHTMDVLRVRSADLEIELFCDPAQGERLMRLEVPSAKAVITRHQGGRK